MFIWKTGTPLSTPSDVDVADHAVSSPILLAGKGCELLSKCCLSHQILGRPLQITETSFVHLQRGLGWQQKAQKQKRWWYTSFVNWQPAVGKAKLSPSLPLLGKYSTHCVQLYAGHWRIPSAEGASRGVAVVPSHCQVYSPVCLAEAGRPWQAGAGRETWRTLFPSWLWVCTVCSCVESCWEDLLPWRSFKQPDKLHCPGCEERLRIYEHSLEPNQTHLFCAVLFVKMTSFFMLINKGILTVPWTENATLWVLRC